MKITLKGSTLNEWEEEIIPEHPLLTMIKEDSLENKFNIQSVYTQVNRGDFEQLRLNWNLSEITSGAFFNGNFESPKQAIAQIQGVRYNQKHGSQYSSLLLSSKKRQVNPHTQLLIEGFANYNLLSFCDSIDHDTRIRGKEDRLHISNGFTERFSFNIVGRNYLQEKLSGESRYQTLVLMPSEIDTYLDMMSDFLLEVSELAPSTLDFEEITGNVVRTLFETEAIDCSNIIMVTEDLIVLSFDKDAVVDLDQFSNCVILSSTVK